MYYFSCIILMQIIDSIKEYSSNINLSQNVYTYSAVFICIVFIVFYLKQNNSSSNSRIYKVKESPKNIALDYKHFYSIGTKSIGKYDIKKGKQVLSNKYSINNINCSKIINGDLVVVNNNELIWIDIDTLDIIDTMPLSFLKGLVTGIDFHMDKWWICEIGKESSIYCFNLDWILEGYWKLPKNILKKDKKTLISGCCWIDNNLGVFLNGSNELYLLKLPIDSVNSKLVKIYNKDFSGNNGKTITAEKENKNIAIWSIKDKDILKT